LPLEQANYHSNLAEQIRPTFPCQARCLLPPPFRDLGVIA
jgi:hypothetical protein